MKLNLLSAKSITDIQDSSALSQKNIVKLLMQYPLRYMISEPMRYITTSLFEKSGSSFTAASMGNLIPILEEAWNFVFKQVYVQWSEVTSHEIRNFWYEKYGGMPWKHDLWLVPLKKSGYSENNGCKLSCQMTKISCKASNKAYRFEDSYKT